MSRRDVTYVELEGIITEMTTGEAADLARSLKPVTRWEDLMGRRVVALFMHEAPAYMVFDDAYAMFTSGIEGAGVAVKKEKRKGKKDTRSAQSRIRDALGGTVMTLAGHPHRDNAVLITLSNGAIVEIGGEIDWLYLVENRFERSKFPPR